MNNQYYNNDYPIRDSVTKFYIKFEDLQSLILNKWPYENMGIISKTCSTNVNSLTNSLSMSGTKSQR